VRKGKQYSKHDKVPYLRHSIQSYTSTKDHFCGFSVSAALTATNNVVIATGCPASSVFGKRSQEEIRGRRKGGSLPILGSTNVTAAIRVAYGAMGSISFGPRQPHNLQPFSSSIGRNWGASVRLTPDGSTLFVGSWDFGVQFLNTYQSIHTGGVTVHTVSGSGTTATVSVGGLLHAPGKRARGRERTRETEEGKARGTERGSERGEPEK
jgi:hypothetical protein